MPAASTVKLFVASAFWRSGLDPDERIEHVPPAGSAGIAEYLSAGSRLTLADLALLMLAVSDNAATNVLLDRLGFDAVNAEIARLGLERTEVRRTMMTRRPREPDLRARPRARPRRDRRRAADRRPRSSSRSTASSATTCPRA